MIEASMQIYEAEKAVIDSLVATAKLYPRNEQKCIEKCIAIITDDRELAEKCIYTVPRGSKKLTGASTHLATLIAQYYGNFRVQSKIIDMDGKHVTAEAIAFDLETNYANKKSTKRLILDKEGGRFNEDMVTVTGNAAASIAQRNAILAVIPAHIVDKIMKSAKRKIAGDVSTADKLKARRKIIVEGMMNKYGVTEKEVLYSIGLETIAQVEEDEIVALIGICTAIDDKGTTVDYAFRGKQAKQATPVVIEDRLVATLKGCQNLKQLEAFKSSLKTNEQRSVYEDMVAKFSEKK